MSKDIFGLTLEGFKKKVESEEKKLDEIRTIFVDVLNQIKYTAEKDGWQRLIIFSENSSFFKGFSYAQRSMFFYYLRRHQNIVSKLSDREKKHVSDSMKPYLLKWVSAEEKNRLGMDAIFFRNVPENIKERIFKNLPNNDLGFFVDVLSVLEFLCGKREQGWIEISIFNIAAFSGVPIENVRFALNTLLKLKLVVLGYVACEQRKGRKKLNVIITFSEEKYQKAVAGEGIFADKIISVKDAIADDFSFVVIKKFYESLLNNVERKKAVEEQTLNFFPEVKQTENPFISKNNEQIEEKTVPAVSPQINVVVPEIKGLNETLADIKNCINAFSDIAEKMHESTAQKNELLDSFVKTSAEQKKEYDELYNQMIIMKKMLNRKEREKNQFIKDIQDSLNMMMGQIISETDAFMRIPRHQMDEYKIQKHKAEVIKIAVQAAEDIRKLADRTEKNN